MTSRVRLRAGETSPFQVFAAGADVDNPDLEDILFDGNQQPFRVKQKGIVNVPNGPGFAVARGESRGVSVPISNPSPSGRHLVLALGQRSGFQPRTPWASSYQGTYLLSCFTSINVFIGHGVGAASDDANVWALDFYTYQPIIGTVCTIFDPEFGPISFFGVIGLSNVPIDVAYCVLHNTVGG